jgi:hypothetical protein
LPNAKRRMPELAQFRAPAGLLEAVDTAAERQGIGPAEWFRRTVGRALTRQGIRVADKPVRDRAAIPAGD